MSQFFEGYSTSVIPGSLILAGVISPGVLAAGTTNNYSPSGLSNVSRIRVTTNAAGSSLGGLQPQVNGFLLLLEVLGPVGDLTLLNQAAGSTAAFRFFLPTDFSIPAGYSQLILYDTADPGWRIA